MTDERDEETTESEVPEPEQPDQTDREIADLIGDRDEPQLQAVEGSLVRTQEVQRRITEAVWSEAIVSLKPLHIEVVYALCNIAYGVAAIWLSQMDSLNTFQRNREVMVDLVAELPRAVAEIPYGDLAEEPVSGEGRVS